MGEIAYPLCEAYGFNAEKRDTRIAMMGLSKDSHAQIEFLHDKVIQPYAKNIVSDFYDVLLSFDEIKEFMLKRVKVERLKLTQLFYLKRYGLKFDTTDYFEQHLKIGQIHAQIGLPLSYYQMAFRVLDEIILNYLVLHIADSETTILPYVKLISNISALDMSLAIETYHGKQINEMSSSIHSLMDERRSLVKKIDLDQLTKAASRIRILDFVRNNLQEAKNKEYNFCIAMIDLDLFKSVNDNYGHIVGDHILRDVADRMMATLRVDDMLGRYGGEEFLLVLPEADIKVAEQITKRICKHVNESPFDIGDHTISISISIGVTEYKENDSEVIILGRADLALYEAKHNGRNQVISM